MTRGISLLSGGLDSQLTICVLRDQGIEVEGLVFASPFFSIKEAHQAAEQLGIKLHVVDFTADIFELIRKAPHGYGGAMNPCIDCHARMIQRAGEFMREHDFDFVSTGEVMNQRPMSQNKRALGIVEKTSGLTGYLLRPLTALLLEPTIPEQDGRVDRSKLLSLEGRNRKPQFALAKQFGLKSFPSPAGGCLLTERGFCSKLHDLIDHDQCDCAADAELLKTGRHFRLPNDTKCIVGRNRADNQLLKQSPHEQDVLVYTVDIPGPTALLKAPVDQSDILSAAGIVSGYGDKGEKTEVIVKIVYQGKTTEISTTPTPRDIYTQWML